MNLANALSFYLTLNVLVIAAFSALRCLPILNSGSRLRLHHAALALVVACSTASLFFPRQSLFEASAKIWSAPSHSSEISQDSSDGPGYFVLKGQERNVTTVPASLISLGALLALGLMSVIGLAYLLRDLRRLATLRRRSHVVKKFGRVRIFVGENSSVPFSYQLFKTANVVIPMYLLSKPAQYRMALQHELQHHRQGDTKTVYAVWFLRLICVANPFVHLWARDLSELQEFACDEALINRGKVDSHAYARCLFEVAQSAEGLKQIPVCATGFAFQAQGHLLKRRINTMLFQKRTSTNRPLLMTVTLALACVLTLSAYASGGLVQDRRVTTSAANKLLLVAESNAELPLAMNDRVLRQLNRYLGTPNGREQMRNALARMERERGPIEKVMKAYGVPLELLAMPLIESGYENLPQRARGSQAAGVWQFIPGTARAYGLRVDEVTDERLDIPLETDAAMRLLMANKLRFKDWWLSISAYNAGENTVQRGINATGSRDAWTLVGNGFEGDSDYLAKLTAAILIMNSPESVE